MGVISESNSEQELTTASRDWEKQLWIKYALLCN